MQVRAIRMGYYGLRRVREGEVFEIPDEPKKKDGEPAAFSDKWMEKVEGKAESKPVPPKTDGRKSAQAGGDIGL